MENKKKEKNIIVMMTSRRRAMKELGRVPLSHNTTSGGGSPRVSLRGLPIPLRETGENIFYFIDFLQDKKAREVSTHT
jgi:hypothetical protein